MKLLFTPNSPYARRARLAVRAAGLGDRVEEIDIDPREENLELLLSHNPSGKVPLLVTDEGAALCESLIIARHLDEISGGRLYPADPGARVTTLEIEGISSALMDSLFVRSREKRRDPDERSPAAIALEAERARRCYDALEARIDRLGDTVEIAAITTVCALGYADGRHPDDGWREGRPRATAWFEQMMQIPDVAATAPRF